MCVYRNRVRQLELNKKWQINPILYFHHPRVIIYYNITPFI